MNAENHQKPSMTTQLQDLTIFLQNGLFPFIQVDEIDGWQERGTLFLCGEDKGQKGYLLAKWRYTAVISIERFPYRELNPYNLLAMIAAHLINSRGLLGDIDDLKAPELEFKAINEDSAHILIRLEFTDDIEAIPDVAGSILFNGKQHKLDMVPVDVAATIDFQLTINADE